MYAEEIFKAIKIWRRYGAKGKVHFTQIGKMIPQVDCGSDIHIL